MTLILDYYRVLNDVFLSVFWVDALSSVQLSHPVLPSWSTHSLAIDYKHSRFFIAYSTGEVKMFSYPACSGQEVIKTRPWQTSMFSMDMLTTTLLICLFVCDVYDMYMLWYVMWCIGGRSDYPTSLVVHLSATHHTRWETFARHGSTHPQYLSNHLTWCIEIIDTR